MHESIFHRLRAYLAPFSLVVGGPALAAAEASGALGGPGSTSNGILTSIAMSAVGLVLSIFVFFVKKEYAGFTAMGTKIHGMANELAKLKLTIEHELGETRTELARRVEQQAHAASLDRIHKKLNRTAEMMTWILGKMGIDPRDMPREGDE